MKLRFFVSLKKRDFFILSTIETNYANPHAATLINGTTYSYDHNGNLATTSAGITNTWNYQNRLTQTSESGTVVDYAYDFGGQRVTKDNGTTTTYYPFPFYEVTDTGSTTKQIYAGDALIATVKDGTIYHDYPDHLGSTNVVTDNAGAITQELDYYPFGDTRIDNQYAGYSVDRQFTGHIKDAETELNYMGARYQNPKIEKFISQDPISQQSPESFLFDPQQMNMYSYARNNPLRRVDPILLMLTRATTLLQKPFCLLLKEPGRYLKVLKFLKNGNF